MDSREDVQDQSPLSDHAGPLEHVDDSGDSQLLFSPEEYRPDTVGTTWVPSCDTLSGNQPEVASHSPGPTADSDGFLPGGDIEDLWLQETIHLNNIKVTMEFVKRLQSASLDDPTLGMSCEALEQLRNPLCEQPSLFIDGDTQLVLDMYLANPSERLMR